MEFRLYDVPTGGVPLWEEFWTGANSVNVSDGLFSVMLGSINTDLTSVVQGHDTLYLGITVGTDSEMEPRVQLGSVPFSVWSLTVADNSITADKITDNAVGSSEIAPDAVGSGEIAQDAVGADEIVTDAVGRGEIATDAVGSDELAADAIQGQHIEAGAITLREMGIARYDFHGGCGDEEGIIYYDSPNGATTLDTNTCPDTGWCCNADETLCLNRQEGKDALVEFSLVGAPNIRCSLLHNEDDSPRKLYYATDGGNGCHMNHSCARLKSEGVMDCPVGKCAEHSWLCGW
jgi:hypothetical protein